MNPGIRFWLESACAALAGALLVLTLAVNTWVELVFHVDPDRGNGSLEWVIVGGALLVIVTSVTLAGREWRRRSALRAA